jgi:hypothetical protein
MGVDSQRSDKHRHGGRTVVEVGLMVRYNSGLEKGPWSGTVWCMREAVLGETRSLGSVCHAHRGEDGNGDGSQIRDLVAQVLFFCVGLGIEGNTASH